MKLAKASSRSSRGFSLIELLVVIAIIAIVIAILIPALRSARITARKAATGATLRDLCSASQAFYTDKKRLPGYFSPVQMGAAANANTNAGFTGMQNVLLDLAGGVTQANVGGTVISVGPGGATPVNVDLAKIGAAGTEKGYFTPRKDALVADAGLSASASNRQLPQIVDAFGNPILAWVADERASTQFASVNSATPARFYWASNFGVLNSTGIGRDQKSQQFSTTNYCSMLGGNATAGNLAATMASLLGNPAYPHPTIANTPAAARGAVLFQSAGADGYFMGSSDRGSKSHGTGGAPPTSVPYVGGTDVMSDYDDVIQSTGS
ncbi:MAG: prepilin-type N-terminal cleavage/methylation domain-containing protein [Phycisphaerales bacterium]